MTDREQVPDYYALNFAIGRRRTLRLVCPGDRYVAVPSRPMIVHGLLIWNAPVQTVVRVWCSGESIEGSGEGMSAEQFDPTGDFERWNKLIDWPQIDTVTGLEVELRSTAGTLIIAADEPDIECVLYGVQLYR